MTNAHDTAVITDLIETLKQQIETCRFVETRVVDHYVLADPENGQILTTENGMQPFRVTINEFERTRDAEAIKGLKAHVREMNPANPIVQRLKIMGWKKAARIQRELSQQSLEKLQAAI